MAAPKPPARPDFIETATPNPSGGTVDILIDVDAIYSFEQGQVNDTSLWLVRMAPSGTPMTEVPIAVELSVLRAALPRFFPLTRVHVDLAMPTGGFPDITILVNPDKIATVRPVTLEHYGSLTEVKFHLQETPRYVRETPAAIKPLLGNVVHID